MEPPRGACLLGDKITQSGQRTDLDRCTECTCANATMVCKRETCPPLDCPVEKQTFSSHNQCCPQCPRTSSDKSDTCIENGHVYTVRVTRRVLFDRHVTDDDQPVPGVGFCFLFFFGFAFYRAATIGKWTSASRACASVARRNALRKCARRSLHRVRPT